MTADQSRFDSINFYIDSPDGPVNVIINELSPGKIYNLFVLVGKSGSAVRALTDALARMITFALESKNLTDVINELSSITSDKSRTLNSGVVVRSIPEAIYVALMRYRNMYPVYNPNSIDMEFRPARFTNPIRRGD